MSKESKLKPQWNSTTKPTEWLKWEETDQTKCSQNVDNRNSHTLLLGTTFRKIILENYLAKPTKVKKAHILLSTNSSPSYILSKTGNIRLTKVIHKKVLATLFVVASNWKPLKMTTSRNDKYILIYSYSGLLCNSESEQTTATQKNMDGSHKYWAKEIIHKRWHNCIILFV